MLFLWTPDSCLIDRKIQGTTPPDFVDNVHDRIPHPTALNTDYFRNGDRATPARLERAFHFGVNVVCACGCKPCLPLSDGRRFARKRRREFIAQIQDRSSRLICGLEVVAPTPYVPHAELVSHLHERL